MYMIRIYKSGRKVINHNTDLIVRCVFSRATGKTLFGGPDVIPVFTVTNAL